MTLEEGIKLFTAFGFGTIFSAVITYFQRNRDNILDFEKQEYIRRREKFLSIYNLLSTGKNGRVKQAIEELELLIKPYNSSLIGKNDEEIKKIGKFYFLRDAHIWNILESFDYSIQQIEILKKYLILLLEYEQEIMRKKIILNTGMILSFIFKAIPVLFCFYMMIFIDKGKIAGWLYFAAILFIILSEIIIPIFKMVDKPNETLIKWLYSIFYIIPVFGVFSRVFFWKIDLFEIFGVQILSVFILMIMFLYNFVDTLSRIDGYSQGYIDKIKKVNIKETKK